MVDDQQPEKMNEMVTWKRQEKRKGKERKGKG